MKQINFLNFALIILTSLCASACRSAYFCPEYCYECSKYRSGKRHLGDECNPNCYKCESIKAHSLTPYVGESFSTKVARFEKYIPLNKDIDSFLKNAMPTFRIRRNNLIASYNKMLNLHNYLQDEKSGLSTQEAVEVYENKIQGLQKKCILTGNFLLKINGEIEKLYLRYKVDVESDIPVDMEIFAKKSNRLISDIKELELEINK